MPFKPILDELSSLDPAPASSDPPKPRRKRGAQPGNKNALKHGVYARRLGGSVPPGLKDTPALAAAPEIYMLRTSIDTILGLIAECKDEDRKVQLFNSLFAGCQRLLSAIRVEARLAGYLDRSVDKLADYRDAVARFQADNSD